MKPSKNAVILAAALGLPCLVLGQIGPAAAARHSAKLTQNVELYLSPTTYEVGDYSTIAWSAPWATECTASATPAYAPWSGPKAVDWAQSVAPEQDTTFHLTCSNGTVSREASISLTVLGGTPSNPPEEPPSDGGNGTPGNTTDINFWLSPDSYDVGGYSTIGWSAPWATECTATASPAYSPWSGPKAVDWAQSVSPEQSTTFTITCSDGTVSKDATVSLTVSGNQPPPPGDGDGGGGTPNDPQAINFWLSPDTYVAGDYSTIGWSAPWASDCTASASPAYAPWSGSKQVDWAQSVAPNVSTVFAIECTNGATSQTAYVNLTVTGDAGGGSGGGGGGGGDPQPPDLPVPDVLPNPIVLTPGPISAADPADGPLLDFAHTANREWSYGGHDVPPDFSYSYGNWDYAEDTYEPWLYDRPTVWYRMYERTGDTRYHDYFLRDLAWYADHITSEGYFAPKQSSDTKYVYITPFLLYERETGDTRYRDVVERLWAASREGFPNNYSDVTPGMLWTERQIWVHMEAAMAYYEITGHTQALARAAALVRQWTEVAGATGAPEVSYTVHEGGGPGGTTPTDLVNSPWMSALYFQAARHYWQLTGDPEVLRQASVYFDWLNQHGLYDGSLAGFEYVGFTFPRYLTGPQLGDASYGYTDMYHCLDVAGMVSFAVAAKQERGEDTTVAQERLQELQQCAAMAFDDMTRVYPTLPMYRLNPPRMWNWWARGAYEISLH